MFIKTKAFGNASIPSKVDADEHYEIIPRRISCLSEGVDASAQSGILLERIEELIRRRSSTDRRMGYVWMLVPILPVLVGIALVVSFIGILASAFSRISSLQQPQGAVRAIGAIIGLYGVAIFSLYLTLLIGAFAFYYLVDRRNNHFKRQQQLFLTLQKYLASKTNSPASDNLSRLSQLSEESIFEEQDRPAGLWSILYLFVTPVVGLILAYNLVQDLRKHEELQSSYQETLVKALSETGGQTVTLTSSGAHKRDPILFIVLAAITGGLFWIYWFYTLLKDYNEHFLDQSNLEDQILGMLRPQPSNRACVTCDGAVPENAKFCPHCGNKQTA